MNLFLRVLEAGKFEINVPADSGLGLQYVNLQGSHLVHSKKEYKEATAESATQANWATAPL